MVVVAAQSHPRTQFLETVPSKLCKELHKQTACVCQTHLAQSVDDSRAKQALLCPVGSTQHQSCTTTKKKMQRAAAACTACAYSAQPEHTDYACYCCWLLRLSRWPVNWLWQPKNLHTTMEMSQNPDEGDRSNGHICFISDLKA